MCVWSWIVWSANALPSNTLLRYPIQLQAGPWLYCVSSIRGHYVDRINDAKGLKLATGKKSKLKVPVIVVVFVVYPLQIMLIITCLVGCHEQCTDAARIRSELQDGPVEG